MQENFKSTLTIEDIMSEATVATRAGQFVRIGELVAQAGELITLGYGPNLGRRDTEGRILVELKEADGTLIVGELRISVFSPQDRPKEILYEENTALLSIGGSDKGNMEPLPEKDGAIREDQKFVFEFKAKEVKTISRAHSNALISVRNFVA